MKTILEFEDTPEDKVALNRYIKSLDMACVLFELSYNMKKE